MRASYLHWIFNVVIAAVWLGNGLFAKLLNQVPRHQQIVGEILGTEHAGWITGAIGLGEILIAVWVVSGRWPRIVAAVQILLVAMMNILEFVLVPELLLWGRLNAVFAFLFIVFVFLNGFLLSTRKNAS